MARWRLGVDVGGTFTDFSLLNVETGDLLVEKLQLPHTFRRPGSSLDSMLSEAAESPARTSSRFFTARQSRPTH